MCLKYKIGAELSNENLLISLKKSPATTWRYGDKISQLKGTACTLDNINGEIELDDGVCSRNGFTVIDDSDSLLFTYGMKGERKIDKEDKKSTPDFPAYNIYPDEKWNYALLQGEMSLQHRPQSMIS